MHYVYDPIPGNNDVATSYDQDRYTKKYGAKANLISNLDENGHQLRGFFSSNHKPLKVVNNTDVLIINAHGSESVGVVGSRCPVVGKFGGDTGKQQYKTLTAADLAHHLKKDGLSKSHDLIRLISCYGSGSAHEPDTNFTAPDHFSRSLAMALANLGYSNIRVSGYQGSISGGTGGKVYKSGLSTKGSQLKYNGLGNVVP